MKEALNYDKGRLGHLTRALDNNVFCLTRKEYSELTEFQKVAYDVMGAEIKEWRGKQKGYFGIII